jgi:hypothetical protein
MFAKRFGELPGAGGEPAPPRPVKTLFAVAFAAFAFLFVAVWAWIIGLLAHAF